jgi:hypothetical protein
MGETARDEKLIAFFGGKRCTTPSPKNRRAAPQIDRHIENGAFENADKLCLRMRRPLKMQAPYGASAHGKRLIILNKVAAYAKHSEIPAAERLHDVSAMIAKLLRLQLPGSQAALQRMSP